MKNAWYLAIDGGGTKTEYRLLDGQFRAAERCLGGCVNHDFLPGGWEDTARELRSAIADLLGRRGLQIGDITDTVAGLSGVDSRTDQASIERCLRDIGLTRFLVCNDGFLPVKAECDGWGIAYNCGTGVCCCGIGEEGRMIKSAGLDEWSGDAGGGRWIAVHLFRAVYQRLFLYGENTYLTAAYQQKFGCRSEEDILDSLTLLKDPTEHPEAARAAVELFFAALEQKDEDAQTLAEKMTDCAAENISVVCRKLGFAQTQIPVVLTGSVHTKAANRVYLDLLEERVQKAMDGRAEIFPASKEPVAGAQKWLEERAANAPGGIQSKHGNYAD